MVKYVLALQDFMINEKICIQLNYEIALENMNGNQICENIQRDLQEIINDYKVPQEGLIFILDISKVNSIDLDIPKVKKILTFLSNNFPDMLNRCIVFNYSKKVKMLFTLIKNFLDKKTSEKIIIDESISRLLDSVTNNPDILESVSTTNNN
tara:strand:- start:3087 stop:3542 length:456 start_codon:yes stop_codon:yes gene_type:complete